MKIIQYKMPYTAWLQTWFFRKVRIRTKTIHLAQYKSQKSMSRWRTENILGQGIYFKLHCSGEFMQKALARSAEVYGKCLDFVFNFAMNLKWFKKKQSLLLWIKINKSKIQKHNKYVWAKLFYAIKRMKHYF